MRVDIVHLHIKLQLHDYFHFSTRNSCRWQTAQCV